MPEDTQSPVNDSATSGDLRTPLTHPRSRPVHPPRKESLQVRAEAAFDPDAADYRHRKPPEFYGQLPCSWRLLPFDYQWVDNTPAFWDGRRGQ